MTTMSSMGIGLVACIPSLRVFGQCRPVFWRYAVFDCKNIDNSLLLVECQFEALFRYAISHIYLNYLQFFFEIFKIFFIIHRSVRIFSKPWAHF